jgi:hypothetical protein
VITETLSEAILGADAAFFEALVESDIQALEALLSDQFLIIDVASGTVHSRAAFLDAIGGRMVTFEQIETFPAETTIRLAGSGAGIVVGRTVISLADVGGAHTDVASRGRWRSSAARARVSERTRGDQRTAGERVRQHLHLDGRDVRLRPPRRHRDAARRARTTAAHTSGGGEAPASA